MSVLRWESRLARGPELYPSTFSVLRSCFYSCDLASGSNEDSRKCSSSSRGCWREEAIDVSQAGGGTGKASQHEWRWAGASGRLAEDGAGNNPAHSSRFLNSDLVTSPGTV